VGAERAERQRRRMGAERERRDDVEVLKKFNMWALLEIVGMEYKK
jgi:hypothetical protein